MSIKSLSKEFLPLGLGMGLAVSHYVHGSVVRLVRTDEDGAQRRMPQTMLGQAIGRDVPEEGIDTRFLPGDLNTLRASLSRYVYA